MRWYYVEMRDQFVLVFYKSKRPNVVFFNVCVKKKIKICSSKIGSALNESW